MPRLVNRLPAYRHHRARDLAFVVLNGRRVYLGQYDSPESRQAYARAINEWLVHHRQPTPPTGSAIFTVDELSSRYWKWANGYYLKHGVVTSEVGAIRSALRPLSNLYGDTAANEFSPLALKAIREEMIKAGLCRKSVNMQVGRVRRAFRWAVGEGLVHPGVLQALAAVPGLRRGRSAARESQPVRPVPEEHINAVLPLVSRQVAAMIHLQILTGMRPSEVATMRLCDMDMRATVWEYRPQSHKVEHHDKERTVYIGPKAQEVLRSFLRPDPTGYLFDPSSAEAERNTQRRAQRATPLWPSHVRAQERKRRRRSSACVRPGHYTEAAYRRAIDRACVRAGVPHWTPHRLRHNAGTLVRREFGVEVARVVLGHASIGTTEIYAEADQLRAKSAMERLG